MTPKEKAKDLLTKYFLISHLSNENSIGNPNFNQRINAQEACLILINEVFDVLESGNLYMEFSPSNEPGNVEYWIEVKKEVECFYQ
jgi:hypothetical protein